jgi:hypothetical protein
MNNQQQFHQHQNFQHQHHQQHRQPYQAYQQQSPPQHSQEQRREFLWRERVKLEMQVQALTASLTSLSDEWQLLQSRKATVQQQKPKLAAQILLSGFVGARQLPAERLHQYAQERIQQEEARIQQLLLRCHHDLAGLQDQIEVILLELSFLP